MKDLMEKRVKELLEVEADKIDSETFKNQLDQAKLGMIYIRDREMMKRIEQGQMIRVVSFISGDLEERRKYIEISMPQMIPIENKK